MASKLCTLVEKGAYKGGKIPMQELDRQRREGVYFRRGLIFGGGGGEGG